MLNFKSRIREEYLTLHGIIRPFVSIDMVVNTELLYWIINCYLRKNKEITSEPCRTSCSLVLEAKFTFITHWVRWRTKSNKMHRQSNGAHVIMTNNGDIWVQFQVLFLSAFYCRGDYEIASRVDCGQTANSISTRLKTPCFFEVFV